MKKQGQLSNQIKKLQYQLSYSQHINKQLSAQLAALCSKMGINPNKFKQNAEIGLINSSTHLQQLYYVEPLLMCYEETIHLLKSEIDEANEQAKGISENAEKIINENSFLRKELQAKIELLTKSNNLGLNINFLTLQSRDLKDKISILSSKNDFLMRKNNQLAQENEKMRLQNRQLFKREQLDRIAGQAKDDQRKKQTEIINYKSDVEILKNKLDNEQSLAKDLQSKIGQLENQILKLKNQVKLTRQQLQNSQILQQRVKQNLQIQLNTAKNQLSISVKKEQELFAKTMSLQSELQDRNNRIHNLNVQNSQLQTNNNNMLQMLEGYEVKVSTLSKKIKKLETQAKQISEEKIELAKRAEVSEWKLSEKSQQAQRRESEWKKQKARLNKMWEERLDVVRKSCQTSNNIGK